MNGTILLRKSKKVKSNENLPECLQRTIILGHEDDIPIVACAEVGPPDRRRYSFWCERCGHEHYHGVGDGHRLAHCSSGPYMSGVLFGKLSKKKGKVRPNPDGPNFVRRGYILQKV